MTDRRHAQIDIARIPVSGGWAAFLAIVVLLGAMAVELPALRQLAMWAIPVGALLGGLLIALRRSGAGKVYDATEWRRVRAIERLLLAGVSCIFLGETFCLLGLPAAALAKAGPLRSEQVVHVVCHVVLYTGMALVIAGAAFHWRAGKGPRKAGGS